MTASPAVCVSALRQRLHASLAQLHQTLQHSERQLVESDELFDEWQRQWNRNGEELTEKLRLLDRRLKEVLGDVPARPQFSIVGD